MININPVRVAINGSASGSRSPETAARTGTGIHSTRRPFALRSLFRVRHGVVGGTQDHRLLLPHENVQHLFLMLAENAGELDAEFALRRAHVAVVQFKTERRLGRASCRESVGKDV